MSAANELLTAIHARLTGDAGLRGLIGADGIRDRLVSGKRLPCIVIGEMTSGNILEGEVGEEHRFSLDICCEEGGHKAAGEIVAMVDGLLDDAALTLQGHHLVGLQHLLTRSRREVKTRMHIAEMRFRAVTEPVDTPPA